MNRWKAATLHLAISALVIVSIIGVVIWLWYPPALLAMSKLDHLIGIIAAVDVTAGPLLTLIVYKRHKPSLKLDLSVIAAIQLALLGYGLYTLAQVRPVFLVGVIDRFEMVAANEIERSDLDKAKSPFDHLSWTGPVLVGAELPFDAGLRAAVLERTMAGSDLQAQPQFYVAFDAVRATLASRAKPLQRLLDRAAPQEQQALLSALGGHALEEAEYLPIHSKRGNALMLVDHLTAEPIAPVGVDPWNVEVREADQNGH